MAGLFTAMPKIHSRMEMPGMKNGGKENAGDENREDGDEMKNSRSCSCAESDEF